MTTSNKDVLKPAEQQSVLSDVSVPKIVMSAGDQYIERFLEYFPARTRNEHTKEAYYRAISQFFSWMENTRPGTDFLDIDTLDVSTWIDALETEETEKTKKPLSDKSIQQRLAAVTSLFDWFKLKQLIAINPASPIKLVRERSLRGKTDPLTAKQASSLLESIPTSKKKGQDVLTVAGGLRDRALIALMLFTFARISAAVKINFGDVSFKDERMFVSLLEKGKKRRSMPCSTKLETYLLSYLSYLQTIQEVSEETPLFQAMDRSRKLNGRRLHRTEAWYMVRRRGRKAGISEKICNHTFRATGLTTYLQHKEARIEHAQDMAGHADPSTTLLYDHRQDKTNQQEVEKIEIG